MPVSRERSHGPQPRTPEGQFASTVTRAHFSMSNVRPRYLGEYPGLHCWCGATISLGQMEYHHFEQFLEFLNTHASCPEPTREGKG